MKKYLLAFFLAAALGTALHYAYALLPVPLVGMFAPVSESVWEHLKLLYWPMLAAGFFLAHGKPDAQRAWSGFLAAIPAAPLLLLGVYYVLLGGFGFQSLFADVSLYYAVLALGFFLAYRLEKSGRLTFLAGILVILTGLYGAALILFTLTPPALPIFTEIL